MLNLDELLQAITKAHESFRQAIQAHLEATLAHLKAEAALEKALADGLREGLVQGKNKEEREASARGLYPELFEAVVATQEQLSHAKANLDTARSRIDELALLVRAMEAWKPHTWEG